jgi:hypothetical protein
VLLVACFASNMAVRKPPSAKPLRRVRPVAGNDSQLVVRLPGALVGRVDQYAARMRRERVLLTRALDQLTASKGKP